MTPVERQLALVTERIRRAAERAGRDGSSITLVAVSKRVDGNRLREAVAAGQMIFGENYLQEAVDKIDLLPGEVTWHFIGGIQSNKLKVIAEKFDVVETVDRVKIIQGLERHLASLGKIMPIFVQVNIGREPQKAGALPEEVDALVAAVQASRHLRLQGLMTMPPYHDNPEESRGYFRQMKALADGMLERGVVPSPLGLSMGMSGDFEVAIEEGATVVRVGSALFGERV